MATKRVRGPQYGTLRDAAVVTGDLRYGAGGAAIYYAKRPTFTADIEDMSELSRTHARVGDVNESDLEEIFMMMQGERWSPQGNARELITRLGLRHTSMSVGDVVVLGEGRAYVVASFGFDEIPFRVPGGEPLSGLEEEDERTILGGLPRKLRRDLLALLDRYAEQEQRTGVNVSEGELVAVIRRRIVAKMPNAERHRPETLMKVAKVLLYEGIEERARRRAIN